MSCELQVIVEKAEKSDILDIDKKKCGRNALSGIQCYLGTGRCSDALSMRLWHLSSVIASQVSGASRPDSGAICLCDPQEDQGQPREGHLHVREERVATNR
jgi:hypothetical protein